MKIIAKSMIPVSFNDLKVGDIFRNVFDEYYLKTNLLEINGRKIANAVDLRTCSLVLFCKNFDVFALDAYSVIGGDDKNGE